jgi:hypothetical protein
MIHASTSASDLEFARHCIAGGLRRKPAERQRIDICYITRSCANRGEHQRHSANRRARTSYRRAKHTRAGGNSAGWSCRGCLYQARRNDR